MQHGIGCRAATCVVVPEVIPQTLARRARRAGPEGAALRGAEGGVRARRLHGRRLGPGRARPRARPRSTSSSAPRPTSRSTTGTATRCSPTSSSGSAVTRPFRRSCCPGRPSSATAISRERAPLARRPRSGDRRAEPRRVRRPRDLGGRHDEPRGGRARDPGVDDLRRSPRRSRRRAHRRRPAAPSHRTVDDVVLAKRAPAAAPATRDPRVLLELMLAPS